MEEQSLSLTKDIYSSISLEAVTELTVTKFLARTGQTCRHPRTPSAAPYGGGAAGGVTSFLAGLPNCKGWQKLCFIGLYMIVMDVNNFGS